MERNLFDTNFHWDNTSPICQLRVCYNPESDTGTIIVRMKVDGVTYTVSGYGEDIICDTIPPDIRYLDVACRIIMFNITDYRIYSITRTVYEEYHNAES